VDFHLTLPDGDIMVDATRMTEIGERAIDKEVQIEKAKLRGECLYTVDLFISEPGRVPFQGIVIAWFAATGWIAT
jgi:hypothetical protein